MSEEAKNPGRAVPRATFAVIAAVLLVSSFLPTIGMSVFPVHPDGHGGFTTDLATQWKGDPVAGIVTFFHPEALAFWAGVWVSILAFTILVIATNAGLIGISRLSFSLASHGQFPGAFSRLHPRFHTPFVSIIVFGIVAALLILPGQIDLMASVYSLAATFAFATAHVAVMRLRFVEPDLRRPFRMPLNVRWGRSAVPLLSVIGAVAIGAVFTQLLFQNIQDSTFIYLGWLVAGILIFVGYRKAMARSLWQPLAVPPRPGPARPLRPYEQIGQKYTARVRVDRRVKEAATPVRPAAPVRALDRVLGALSALGNVRRLGAIALLGASAALVVLLVTVAIRGAGPLGPAIRWSPGVLLVLALFLYLLARGRNER
jgi:amino acid transporter